MLIKLFGNVCVELAKPGWCIVVPIGCITFQAVHQELILLLQLGDLILLRVGGVGETRLWTLTQRASLMPQLATPATPACIRPGSKGVPKSHLLILQGLPR